MIRLPFRRRRAPRLRPSYVVGYRDGTILLAQDSIPAGAIALFRFNDPLAAACGRPLLERALRRDGLGKLYVPGAAHASTERAAVGALDAWADLVAEPLSRRLPAGRCVTYRSAATAHVDLPA